jgi:hypothetical protein
MPARCTTALDPTAVTGSSASEHSVATGLDPRGSLRRASGWALALGLVWFTPCAAAEVEKILFIGNSYTQFNDLPAMIRAIAVSAGRPVPEVAMHAPGGCTLKKHLAERRTVELIERGDWDVIVVQGQSQEAAFAAVNAGIRADFLDGGSELCQRFKAANPNGRIVLFQTWPRHPDLWKVAPAEAGLLGADAAEMQRRNHDSYAQLAAGIAGSVVAPVGDAWALKDAKPGAPRLHAADNSHPAPSGSYLAALVIYGTIYDTDSLAVEYRGSLGEAEATHLQSIAQQALRAAAEPVTP